jgi:hypothetical protein
MDEHYEILSERSAAAEEEEQAIDNRSMQGDTELEIPSYYCTTCKKPHFEKCFAVPSTLSTTSAEMN